MPIEPAEKAPSVYQPRGADAPVPKRQQRVANRGRAARKSILQPLTSRVQGASSPHRTVRLAMYGVLVVIAMIVLHNLRGGGGGGPGGRRRAAYMAGKFGSGAFGGRSGGGFSGGGGSFGGGGASGGW